MTETNDALVDEVGEALGKIFGDASTTTVFSEPEKVGEDLVILAGAWERAGGFGFGAGTGTDQRTGERGQGSGGGGGGMSQGRPVAVIWVTKSGVEVKPVVDLTKIGVTVLLAAIGVWRALR
ncbi:MAG TPA: hypothetical protein VJA46_05685 [Acidimicrobiia bacterium]|nr:hypothetical protein [Acidimicrobiia bacterium]